MTLVVIDPGVSSGYCVFRYTKDTPARLISYGQVSGGMEGFKGMVSHLQASYPPSEESQWVCEKFAPRPSSATGFSHSLKTTLPLVCEGYLQGVGVIGGYPGVGWAQPALQYFAGGSSKAEKKKAQHKWLKDNGLYVTGRMVDSPDADDVRSSIAHAIAWFRRQKHLPTIEKYFPKQED